MAISTVQPISFQPDSVSALGNLVCAEETPVMQFNAIYGVLTQMLASSTSGTGATVDSNTGRFRLQSGTTATTGNATLQSAQAIRLRAGQAITAKFSAAFGTGVSGNTQLVGVGNANDGFFIGYNGTSLGVMSRTSTSGSAVDTWVAQASWNTNMADGSWPDTFQVDATKMNNYMIQYGGLGAGVVKFFVMDNRTGKWVLLHLIKYGNTSANIIVANPNLSFWARCANTGSNTTNTTMYVDQVGIFQSGPISFNGSLFSTDSRKATVTTETCLINLRNATTFNGVTNKGIIRLRSLGISYDTVSGQATFRIYKGTTIGGSPSYAAISGTTANDGVTITSGQSIASVDVAGTTVSGGTKIFAAPASRFSSQLIDLTPFNLFVLPTEILTVAAVGHTSGDMIASLSWTEDI